MPIFDTANLTESTPLTPDQASWIYNGLDCAVTLEAFQNISENFDNINSRTYDLERRLQAPVLDMNMAGLLVDRHALVNAQTTLESKRAGLELLAEEFLRDGYGVKWDWNSEKKFWNSPAQMKWFFYEYLRLPVQRKRNVNGQMVPTTDRNALEKLSQYFVAAPFVNVLLHIRDVTKRLQFFKTEIDPDGYIRTNYNIAGTVTGRFSSAYTAFGTGRNLQNLDPIIKRVCCAANGNVLVELDLEQADSRNVGAACWNKFLSSHGPEFAGSYLDACEGGDLHTIVTRMARPDLGWPDDPALHRAIADAVAYRDYSYRDLSKKLGHGSNYYGKPPTMASHAKIPVPLAAEFQRNYFGAFPCIPEGHRQTEAQLRETGSITTIMGRRRFFFGRLDDEKTLRDAIAFEGQGATADEMNEGLIKLHEGRKLFPRFQLRAQVHDSAMFEVAEEAVHEAVAWAKEALKVKIILEGDREFTVPTDAKVGYNWGPSGFDKTLNKEINPDGMQKWKGQHKRTRQNPHRASYSFL